MKHTKRQGPRNVGPTIELTPEFKHQNYTETIHRMYANGLVSKAKAKEMLANVENLFGEGIE